MVFKQNKFEKREQLAIELKTTENLGNFLDLYGKDLIRAVKQEDNPKKVALVCNELIRKAIQNPEYAKEISDILKHAPDAAVRSNIGKLIMEQYKNHPGRTRVAMYQGRKTPKNVEQARWHMDNLGMLSSEEYALKKIPKKVGET